MDASLKALVARYADLSMFEGYDIRTPECPGPAGDTPFHMVAYDGDVEAAKIMLPHITDINRQGDLGYTPLHYAVSHRKPEMAMLLILNGADIARENDYGDTPLEMMRDMEIFSGLLR